MYCSGKVQETFYLYNLYPHPHRRLPCNSWHLQFLSLMASYHSKATLKNKLPIVHEKTTPSRVIIPNQMLRYIYIYFVCWFLFHVSNNFFQWESQSFPYREDAPWSHNAGSCHASALCTGSATILFITSCMKNAVKKWEFWSSRELSAQLDIRIPKKFTWSEVRVGSAETTRPIR
jgi:hypothetical protein